MLDSDLSPRPGCSRRSKRLLFSLLIPILIACNLSSLTATATPTPTPPPSPTLPPTAYSPASQLGTKDNPIILALPPSAATSNEVVDSGRKLVGILEQATGYTIVSVIPPSEPDLVAGFGNGNAHIGVLSPFGYLLASEQGAAEATFGRAHNGSLFYGAQFIAHRDIGFTAYYDPLKNGNMADATAALAQFQSKKPCWTDDKSPSGYVVPLGYLKEANVQTLEPAFLAGHAAVVRAVDMSGVCDFGATYIDARTYPGLQDQYPNLLRDVQVIWRMPDIIPYETMVFERGMDEGIRRNLITAFVNLMTTPDGQSAMQTIWGFDAMQVVQDSQYDDFRKVVKDSGVDLNALIK